MKTNKVDPLSIDYEWGENEEMLDNTPKERDISTNMSVQHLHLLAELTHAIDTQVFAKATCPIYPPNAPFDIIRDDNVCNAWNKVAESFREFCILVNRLRPKQTLN